MMLTTRPRPTRLRRTPRHLLMVVAMVATACPLGARLVPASAADPGVITTIAGVDVGRTPQGRAVELSGPRTAAVDGTGAVWFTDTGHHQIKRLDPATDLVTVVAGTGFAGGPIGDGGHAVAAGLNMPHGVAVDNPGGAPRTLYIADSANNRIRKVALDSGVITTVAGTGRPGFGGDGGPAVSAPLDHPRFLVVAPDGSLIVADTGNARVRRIDPQGTIRTIAGTGHEGDAGDGGPASGASLDDPRGLALDAAGNLYISGAEGVAMPSVRRVDPNGIITTVAGGHPAGYSGDGGPATAASLNTPRSIAVWGSDLYIADSDNSRIRAVDLAAGVITTVAGTGAFGYGGDGGPAISASLDQPRGVAVTPRGDLVIGDTRNARLRFVRIPRTPPAPPVTAPAPAVETPGPDPSALPSTDPAPDPAPAPGNDPRTDPVPADIRPFGTDAGPAVLRPPGYRLVASDGGVFAFGDAGFFGSTGAVVLAKPIVGMAPVPSSTGPSGAGYWLVGSDGGVFAFGDAGFFGSTGAVVLAKPIVGMAPVPSSTGPSGAGYWLVGSDGGVFAFGDAGFFGSTGAVVLAKPIVGMAASPSGAGYWLVASDGGVFAFGDAGFFGSTGAVVLAKPIVGMAASPSGAGYWLVASDGGVFAFGDAGFFGSPAGRVTDRPVVGLSPSPTGRGYRIATGDGRIFSFGDAPFLGAVTEGLRLPVVGIAR